MKLVRVPAGQFVMGSQDGLPDEAPRARVQIAKPFWMGVCEVTNKQYGVFDPEHDTRYLDETGKDHATPGHIANHPDQPVARVSWKEAMAFCRWLSAKTGKTVTLPTEAQWEWAARAGTAGQFHYGDADTDFGPFANLADSSRRFLYSGFPGGSKLRHHRPYPKDYLYPLRDDRFKDNWFVVDFVGQCKPNAWGLKDMVGNVWEWTLSSYRPYPYKAGDGRNSGDAAAKKVTRGGSWYDRPKTAGSSIRLPYESYQKVHNVGFRVIVE
jgi:formylglycine-generating enzyme required for sulfatase activity